MAKVKVFLLTYHRNDTLKRSVNSLLDQTFTDWVCEVHNDDPLDLFPAEYVRSLNDPRLTIVNHSSNMGPVLAFNLVFDTSNEAYLSILEDDNWWEPEFLDVMVNELNNNSNIQVAWANMYLWQEEPNNKWTNLNKTIWPLTNSELILFNFPHFKQAFTAIHSNGAMLVRNKNLEKLKTPENIRFDFAETIRERSYQHPLLLVNKPLAHFALTISTNREHNIKGFYEHYLLLIDSFFECVKPNDEYSKSLWDDARKSKLLSYNKLLYAGLIGKASRKLLKHATMKEWITFLLYNVKHPTIFMDCMNAKKNYETLWEYLLWNTKARVKEAQHSANS